MKYSIVEMEMKADVRLQTIIRRGDIFMADLPKGIGCEQGGRRPVVVMDTSPVIDMTDDEKIDVVAARILKKYKPAFLELAK